MENSKNNQFNTPIFRIRYFLVAFRNFVNNLRNNSYFIPEEIIAGKPCLEQWPFQNSILLAIKLCSANLHKFSNHASHRWRGNEEFR